MDSELVDEYMSTLNEQVKTTTEVKYLEVVNKLDSIYEKMTEEEIAEAELRFIEMKKVR